MEKPQRFRARLEDAGGGGAAFDVPARVAAALGERKRPPVTVTIRNHTFRTTVAVYGGQPMIGVNKQHRAAAGVDVGDAFDVVVALDDAPRVVEVPADLAGALDDDARAAFDRMSHSHRREYVEWIADAKRPATRARRVAETVERVRGGAAEP
ncbi:MAG TPA: YdeI/OmpD-associated family protein [Acidimicrobiales bacterium]|nr:YdeI/OmpD-associated family protein [Acidimicrobiales bacterium]